MSSASHGSGPSARLLLVVAGVGVLTGVLGIVVAAVLVFSSFSNRQETAVHDELAGEASRTADPVPLDAAAAKDPIAAVPDADAPTNPAPAASDAMQEADGAAESTVEPLRYGWKPGHHYSYRYRLRAKVGSNSISASGGVTYTAKPFEEQLDERTEEEEVTGSGFVVTPEGHLVTCAHVVSGAKKIDVTLADRTCEAEILALDKGNDLALLKLDSAGWDPPPLGAADRVQLAQDVHVVGYPLTDVLGRSIKITRGAVAGIIDRDGSKTMQVDAAINSGNSGGPVVDDTGRVIGVVSTNLFGETVSNLGFAVSVDEVKRLLSMHGVHVASGAAAAPLTGEEVAQRITPSVAFLKVTIGPQGYGAEKRMNFFYQGHARYRGRVPEPNGPGQFSWPDAQSDQGSLVIDTAGEVYKAGGSAHFPFLMGPQALLAIEPLDAGRPSWRRERGVSIVTKKKDQSRLGPGFHRPFPVHPFGPRSEKPKETIESITPAFERYIYELGPDDGDTVEIKKRFELETLEEGDDLKVSGTGTVVFNKAEGVPESMTFEATFALSEGNFAVRVPVTLSYQRVPGDAVSDSKGSISNPLPTPHELLRTPKEYEIEDLLEKILDGGNGTSKAMRTLRGLRPTDRRKEVAIAVAKYLSHDSLFVRQEAAWTLQVWYVEENIPELIKALSDSHFPVRHSAIWILSQFPETRCAESIVSVYPGNTVLAKPSLIRMGPIAEDAVLTLVDHKAWTVRQTASHVLSRIGTEKSLPRLKELAKENSLAGGAAKGALNAIQLRVRSAEER